MNKCLKCDKETNNPKFCSQSCAAKYNNSRRAPRTIESRLKTSNTLIKLGIKPSPIIYYEGPVTKIKRKTCTHCKQEFWSIISSKAYAKKTCSDYCRYSKTSVNAVIKKRIPYSCKESNSVVYLQSSWELKIAIWLDHNNIRWIRPSKMIIWFDKQNKRHRYLPDFYLLDYNLYLDPKNPIGMSQQQYKLTEVRKQITLLAGNVEDIIQEFWCSR